MKLIMGQWRKYLAEDGTTDSGRKNGHYSRDTRPHIRFDGYANSTDPESGTQGRLAEEGEERSELDKIKEVFANGGAQAIELADMVGLGDDPAVYEMKEMVKVVIEVLDAIAAGESFSPTVKASVGDKATSVWYPLVKKSLKKIYGVGVDRLAPDPQWDEQFQSLYADMSKLMKTYWGWYDAKEAASVVENLGIWAGHPVEMPS